MRDVWSIVHAERNALIADLEGVDAQRWDLPSLCGDWTIHDVVAHLIDTAKTRLAQQRRSVEPKNSSPVSG